MMTPTVHLNGTSREDLRLQYLQAIAALHLAAKALAGTCPNGRDYYPQGPDAIQRALQEHCDRSERLDALITEMQCLCMELTPEQY
jgi:hypothetical protein